MLRPGRPMMTAPPSLPGQGLPEFTSEFTGGMSYRVRNVSTATAHGVSVDVPDAEKSLTRALPQGIDLPPLASTNAFIIISAMGYPLPGELLVSCAELDEPVRVPLPPRVLPR
jgi:hypothetical protein